MSSVAMSSTSETLSTTMPSPPATSTTMMQVCSGLRGGHADFDRRSTTG